MKYKLLIPQNSNLLGIKFHGFVYLDPVIRCLNSCCSLFLGLGHYGLLKNVTNHAMTLDKVA